MVATARPTDRQMSAHLQKALDEGYLTQAQLRELIEFEASQLGFTIEEAIQRSRSNSLPQTPLGFDLQLLVSMLVA